MKNKMCHNLLVKCISTWLYLLICIYFKLIFKWETCVYTGLFWIQSLWLSLGFTWENYRCSITCVMFSFCSRGNVLVMLKPQCWSGSNDRGQPEFQQRDGWHCYVVKLLYYKAVINRQCLIPQPPCMCPWCPKPDLLIHLDKSVKWMNKWHKSPKGTQMTSL